jgi:hypothetical protein
MKQVNFYREFELEKVTKEFIASQTSLEGMSYAKWPIYK